MHHDDVGTVMGTGDGLVSGEANFEPVFSGTTAVAAAVSRARKAPISLMVDISGAGKTTVVFFGRTPFQTSDDVLIAKVQQL